MRSSEMLKNIMQAIDAEISWCEEHPEHAPTKEYGRGFINGLIQARLLIVKVDEALDDEHWEDTVDYLIKKHLNLFEVLLDYDEKHLGGMKNNGTAI